MAERPPRPSAHTHGDGWEKYLFDRMLTELEGIHDLLADRAAAHQPPTAPSADAEPVTIPIQEPAPTPARPPARKRTPAKPAPASEES